MIWYICGLEFYNLDLHVKQHTINILKEDI